MKGNFKPGDLVRVAVFSYEPDEVGVVIRQLTWREMIEINYDKGEVMWQIHFPDTNEVKPYAEKWLVLVK